MEVVWRLCQRVNSLSIKRLLAIHIHQGKAEIMKTPSKLSLKLSPYSIVINVPKRFSERLVQCEKCQVWFCTGCGKIGENIMSLLDECASLHWFCECCNTAAINAIRSFSNSPESPLEVLQSSVSDAINQINNLVADAKEQLKKTFSEAARRSEGTSSTDVSEAASMDTELAPGLLHKPESLTVKDISQAVSSCMFEEKEKQRRRLNLIVHNLAESSSTEGLQRKLDDTSKVTSILTNTLQVPAKIINAVRLGKKVDTKDKARLLKITVETEKEKASILRNAFKLRNKELPEHLRKIFITPDMTPKEREEHKVLRAKLFEVNKSGNNYKIKTVK